ncbi:MAG: uroporphyrinogen decarboxylase family protein [Verrucomicrobiota bacterium]
MNRQRFLDIASAGLRMPIGTHLVLHEHADHETVVLDGRRLGRVVEEAARRFRTPLAFPLMDLKLEKEALLLAQGVAPPLVEAFRFVEVPGRSPAFKLTPRMMAICAGINYIATQTNLLPVGIAIGPFSLMTQLIADPITPVFMAGAGSTASEDDEVALVERLLELSFQTIREYLAAQMDAGAEAIILCEPAANKVYFSPNQLAESYDVFERYVMRFNLALRDQLAANGVELIFHNCGELLDGMVSRFALLDAAMMSLGSSRKLWEDAALLPRSTVLYGNLPTKQFYSDRVMSLEKVRELAAELSCRMRATGHPFVLGSECDVLSVPGSERTIQRKVSAFLDAN